MARVLFVHSNHLGWRTYSGVLRRLVASEPRLVARFTRRRDTSIFRSGWWAPRRGTVLPALVRPWQRYVAGGLDVIAALRGFDPDLIHAAGHRMAWAPSLLRRSRPLVVTLDATALQLREHRGAPAWLERFRLRRERLLLKRCTEVHCTSEWAYRSVTGALGVPEDRVRVTPYFTFGPDADVLERERAARRSRSRPHIAFIGNDFERKGGYLLLDVHRRRFAGRATLHVFSSASIPAAACGEGVVVHGSVPNERLVRELLPRMDLLVLPSRFDQTPYAIVEAFACAVPVIASTVGGIPWLVSDGVDGRLIRPDREGDLESALSELVDDPVVRERMADAARRRFLERHDADVAGRAFVQRLVECAATARRAR